MRKVRKFATRKEAEDHLALVVDRFELPRMHTQADIDDGTLDNSAGNGINVTNGILLGNGTVLGNVLNQDTVAPGNSTGILTLTGSYNQDTTGIFSAEIGGTDNSDPDNPQFDVLDVSLTASLDGMLELGLAGYTPVPSDTFAILTASSVVGTFNNVADGARLNVSFGGSGSFQVDYNASSVVLSDFIGIGATFSADFDGDGDVDGNDLAQWEGDFGLNGDSDADGHARTPDARPGTVRADESACRRRGQRIRLAPYLNSRRPAADTDGCGDDPQTPDGPPTEAGETQGNPVA